MNSLLEVVTNAKVYDLAQPLYAGVPHFPTHPPFAFSLSKLHGEYVLKNGGSSASELIAMGGHTGTHIDALCHFSCGGKLFGDAALKQSAAGGIEPHSVDTIAPIVRRGVLLDIAGQAGVDVLADDFIIKPEHLDAASVAGGIDVRTGDVVVLRTGWGRYWHDQHQYTTGGKGVSVMGPGPEEAAARMAEQTSRVRRRLRHHGLRAGSLVDDAGACSFAGWKGYPHHRKSLSGGTCAGSGNRVSLHCHAAQNSRRNWLSIQAHCNGGASLEAMANFWTVLRDNPNYRYTWMGQVVSEIGDHFNSIAVLSLAVHLTGSGMAVGGVMIARTVCAIIAGPIAGVVLDRFDRKRIMIASDVIRAVIAAGFVLILTHQQRWLLYALSGLLMFASPFFTSGRSAILPRITSAEELHTANALTQTTAWLTLVVRHIVRRHQHHAVRI